MSPKSSSGSSSSAPSVRRKTAKTRKTARRPASDSTSFLFEEWASASSPSPLEQVYQSKDFQLQLANNLTFHVARQAICLRRYRDLTQGQVAERMGTSQSKVARIEGGRENVTLETVERLVEALGARCRLLLEPAELHLPEWPDWSDCYESGVGSLRPFHFRFAAIEERADGSGNLYGVWRRDAHTVNATSVNTFGGGQHLEQGKPNVT